MSSANNLISARFQVLVPSRKLKTKVSVHNTGRIFLLVLTKSYVFFPLCLTSCSSVIIDCAISCSPLLIVPHAPVVMTPRQTQYAKHRPCHQVKPRCMTNNSVVSTETFNATTNFILLVTSVRSSISCLPVTFWNSI